MSTQGRYPQPEITSAPSLTTKASELISPHEAHPVRRAQQRPGGDHDLRLAGSRNFHRHLRQTRPHRPNTLDQHTIIIPSPPLNVKRVLWWRSAGIVAGGHAQPWTGRMAAA
ncbi:hypothetical protein ABGB18_34950 [Nonomuraea sp. B12E4]|uniref:hypothetical protein n=1 Tax=Nonomuraea sp. B12E4 TaxID=3153564 RepID=UPI00325DA940